MPRISLWKDGAHTNDFKFFDKNISETSDNGYPVILKDNNSSKIFIDICKNITEKI